MPQLPRPQGSPPPPGGGEEKWDFLSQRPGPAPRPSTPKKRSTLKPLVWIGVAVVACAAIAIMGLAFFRTGSIEIAAIDDQTIDELHALAFPVHAHASGTAATRLRYGLVDAPAGSRIDAETGVFTWQPARGQGTHTYSLAVQVASESGLSAERTFQVVVRHVVQPPVIESIGSKTVKLNEPLAFAIQARNLDSPNQPLRFDLDVGAPAGARVDPVKGQFEWTPREVKPGTTLSVKVLVRASAPDSPVAQQTFPIRVEAPELVVTAADKAVDQFIAGLRASGAKVGEGGQDFRYPLLSGTARPLSIDGQPVAAYGYETEETADRDSRQISAEVLKSFTGAHPGEASAYLFRHGEVVAFYAGTNTDLVHRLEAALGNPLLRQSPPEPEKTAQSEPKPAEPKVKADPGDEQILDLYRKNRILAKLEYPKIRKVYADRFEAQHQDVIQRVFGEPDSEIRKWLQQRPEIKEEFYLAIDPKFDDVPKVLALFKELKEKFPKKFEAYANLAIAVSVVWDKEQAIQGSPMGQHKSVAPEGQLGALENFQYYVEAESAMQGRIQFLPWEFLVHIVNHRTTLPERQWALAHYLPRRAMFGKCYSDVPYDYGMLSGQEPRLTGKPHTLPNQLAFGGVCSCQADYAGRVGKSLGIPAFVATAANKFGDLHAWVMWVELGTVTRTGFTFSLQSHGRYRGDNYYVGHLTDPHTAQTTTDRQTELRLHTVGMDPIAKRQAELVMRSYPMLREAAQLDEPHQLLFLGRLLDFCPGNEEAWQALAKMSRDGQITKTNAKPMVRIMDRLFTTFSALPDFTWTVFDDMVAYEDRPKQRAMLFSRLAGLYEHAARADLSCEARLKFTDYLLANKRDKDAIENLATAIMIFPDEGRYVPKMLDKLEELCHKEPRYQEQLVAFYQQFLPRIPQKRGDAPSPYCLEMYKRAVDRFREAGATQLAQLYDVQRLRLEALKPTKP